MISEEGSPFITIYLEVLEPFLRKDNIKSLILRYLHDRGIEGDLGEDVNGEFVRYYKPPAEDFDTFSREFFKFITNGGK